MKIGIGLPNTMAFETDRRLMLEWARRADEAGFDVLGTIDEPNFDSWDPLVTLAGAAGVTERARLATTILQLPPRNEVLVAKQAAVVDQLSGGRLVLGLAQGGREDDFEVFGAEFEGRSERFERQVARIREIWQTARESDRDHGVIGPPPVQEPGSPIWAGALQPKAVERAARVADGFIFGTIGAEYMKQLTPQVRGAFEAQGKPNAEIAGLRTSPSVTTPNKRSRRQRITSCATTDNSGRNRRTSSTTGRARRSRRRSRRTPTPESTR
jgi:alkanesulfonate monooxygenase SsuD/methylene tetrahydromethanopterin reductase-like flavin-dependent oxidoreductase (luciferase family)